MKICYVLKDSGICGGHKVVLEHLKGLAGRGHDCELNYLSSEPNWFNGINFKLKKHGSVNDLINYLRRNNSINVATWWETADWVHQSGGGYYLVQDIETCHSEDKNYRQRVLDSYRLGLHHIVENAHPYAALKYIFNVKVSRVGIAIDHNVFKSLDIEKTKNTVLYFYRSNYLKNPQIMIDAMKGFDGVDVLNYGQGNLKGATNHISITDSALVELMNRSEMFISTSIQEGFCLPLLESMACGTPVITTRAVGNETFCIDNINCLMIETSQDLIDAVNRIRNDKELAKRLSDNGIITANNFKWDKVTSELEHIFSQGVG